ncbi:MAG: amidohydrolase family protein, partial [Acidimicrobiia bacterium]
LWWVGEDRMMWASDYALWEPEWIIVQFWTFELPDEVKQKVGVDLTPEAKRKILGLNVARLYDIQVPVAA